MLKIHISQEGKKKKPDGVFKTAINGTPSGFINIIPINTCFNNTLLSPSLKQMGICRIHVISSPSCVMKISIGRSCEENCMGDKTAA